MGAYQVIGRDGRTLKPAFVTRPGEVLEMELEAREMKKSAFAMSIQMYPAHLSDILKGRRGISAAIALKLEKALDIEAAFWLRMQSEYDLAIERSKLEVA
ncbi:MAG: addiction module antidote protein, HigA family [Pedobacter sp.]|nr:MAG: addiction module antidote protein, HigA family [Pedobacter sp.]